jgi:hypothetical protein
MDSQQPKRLQKQSDARVTDAKPDERHEDELRRIRKLLERERSAKAARRMQDLAERLRREGRKNE